MKVLYVTNGFPPHRWAGTEAYTAAIAREFHGRGESVQVLCVGAWDNGEAYFNGYEDSTYEGIPVRRLNLNWTRADDPFTWLFDNPVTASLYGRWLDEWRPDVVHVTSCETLSASVLRVTRERALPLVLTLTDFWFICPRMTLLRSDMRTCDGRTTAWECTKCLSRGSKAYRWPSALLPERAVAGLLTAVGRQRVLARQPGLRGMIGDMDARKAFLLRAIEWPQVRLTASPFVRQTYMANGVTAPIEVSAYGNDVSWLSAFAGRTASDVLRVGFVGQIIPAKGLHVLLDALRSVPDDLRSRIELVVYGSVRQSPEYGQQVIEQAHGLPVRFMGTFQREERASVMATFDVLVVPSLWYDFPLVIQDALAAGAPVVATNLGGMAEAVKDGVNGFLFEPGDAAMLATHLARLVREPSIVDELRKGIPPVKTVQANADELGAIYASLR